MKTTRPYTMTARSRAAEQTRVRILDATAELAGERLVADISLERVAQRAGVSVQTVLRRFGSRAGLFDEAQRYAEGRIVEERRAPVGDVDAAVEALVDHYEKRGDAVLLMLAQEGTDALTASVTARGKQVHREWVETTFAPFLAGADDPGELTDLLVVAMDVFTWKLLRHDRGLDRATTEARIRRLVTALLPHPRPVS
jgi:AcrR family transcriptional regulator